MITVRQGSGQVLRQNSKTLVPPPGIEPGSYALQASAMTTFAKAAYLYLRLT